MKAPNGSGTTKKSNGYRYVSVPGRGQVLEQTIVAEAALGHRLPRGAVVHHINQNPVDNRPRNLVLCENRAYHLLLHARLRAIRATGDPNRRPCVFCGRYEPREMVPRTPKGQFHRECCNQYRRRRRLAGRRA